MAVTLTGHRSLTGAPSDYKAPTGALLHCISMLLSEYDQAGGNLGILSIAVGENGEGGTTIRLHGFRG